MYFKEDPLQELGCKYREEKIKKNSPVNSENKLAGKGS